MTAGSRSPLLMMAVCDVLPPDSSARPRTFCKSMVAKSEGLKSCETMIRSPGRCSQLNGRSPERFSRIRSGHVLDIAVPFPEIFVFERLVGVHQTVCCLHNGPFRVGVAVPDIFQDFSVQDSVFQNQKMRIQDDTVLASRPSLRGAI